jgi:hypothetical protein
VSCLVYPSALKLEATCSSETSVDFQGTTGRYISEYRTLHNNRCDNLKFYFFITCFHTFTFWTIVITLLYMKFLDFLSCRLYVSVSSFDTYRAPSERNKCMLLAQFAGRSAHDLYQCNELITPGGTAKLRNILFRKTRVEAVSSQMHVRCVATDLTLLDFLCGAIIFSCSVCLKASVSEMVSNYKRIVANRPCFYSEATRYKS